MDDTETRSMAAMMAAISGAVGTAIDLVRMAGEVELRNEPNFGVEQAALASAVQVLVLMVAFRKTYPGKHPGATSSMGMWADYVISQRNLLNEVSRG